MLELFKCNAADLRLAIRIHAASRNAKSEGGSI